MADFHPKGDIDYNIRTPDLLLDPISRVQRSACLFTLTGKKSYAETYATVREKWRNRLCALSRFNWAALGNQEVTRVDGPTKGLVRSMFMRNCPPFGVRYKSGIPLCPPCHRVRVCPWCYGREIVAEAYKGMELALRLLDPAKISIIAVSRTVSLDTRLVPLPRIIALTKTHAREELRLLKTHGVMVPGARYNVTVAPRTNNRHIIEIHRGTLAVAYNSSMGIMPDFLKFKVLRNPTMDQVIPLVAWTMQYPKGMMFGDAETAVDILHVVAYDKVRLSGGTGLLYSSRRLNKIERDHEKSLRENNDG